MANRRMRTVVRLWEEKEGGWGCTQIRCPCHHWDEGEREDLMIATPGRDDTHSNSSACAYMVLSEVQWQLEREEAQRRMWCKMMEEEWSWEEERIAARIVAMLIGMGMGTDMGMGDMDAMMQSQ